MNARLRAYWANFRGNRWASTLPILLTLALGILIGTIITYGVKGKEQKGGSSDATPLQVPAPKQLSNAFSQVAKQIEPSVVNINTESTVKNPHRQLRRRPPQGPQDQNPPDGGDEENPFQDFFDRFLGPFAPPEGMRERSLGSGVIVDPKGYIITNQHVVDKADRIRVKLMDDPPGYSGHEAKVIGTDRETDLAVIKIEMNKALPSAKIGNSDGMEVGDWVLAVGSPFGLQETVTAGIISAKGRNIVPQRQFQSFLQTDAAINPGNSGGPLINLNGEVVGINTAILTESQGYQGVGFAMPSNVVAQVYNQLIGPEHRVTRGSIGVQFMAQPNPAVSRVYGSGIVISEVVPNGPAAKAGLKTGDAIISVEGKPVKTGDELVSEISARKPGSDLRLGYVRAGKEQTTTLTVADRAKLFAGRLGDEEDQGEESQPKESRLGITVRGISPEIASRLGIPAGKGVIVQEVKPGSFADDVGLARGQVILEVNKQPVNSEEDFNRAQNQLKSGQDVVFLVRQGRGANAGTIFLAGTLP